MTNYFAEVSVSFDFKRQKNNEQLSSPDISHINYPQHNCNRYNLIFPRL